MVTLKNRYLLNWVWSANLLPELNPSLTWLFPFEVRSVYIFIRGMFCLAWRVRLVNSVFTSDVGWWVGRWDSWRWLCGPWSGLCGIWPFWLDYPMLWKKTGFCSGCSHILWQSFSKKWILLMAVLPEKIRDLALAVMPPSLLCLVIAMTLARDDFLNTTD